MTQIEAWVVAALVVVLVPTGIGSAIAADGYSRSLSGIPRWQRFLGLAPIHALFRNDFVGHEAKIARKVKRLYIASILALLAGAVLVRVVTRDLAPVG